jgi:hypothetical protein
MRPGWQLVRPISKESYTWEDFDQNMNKRYYENPDKFSHFDPLKKFLIMKACYGDKDEVPRLTTPAPAAKIIDYLTAQIPSLPEKERKILDEGRDILARNFRLAATDWLTVQPDLIDSNGIHDSEVSRVVYRNKDNFYQVAKDLNLFQYLGKWNKISERLQ